MTKSPTAIPLRPDYSAVRNMRDQAMVRAIVCSALAYKHNAEASDIAERSYAGQDDVLGYIRQRASVDPANTQSVNFGSALAATSLSSFLTAIGAPTASAAVLAASTQLDMGRFAAIRMPFVAVGTGAAFVEETQPLPVKNFSLTTGVTV